MTNIVNQHETIERLRTFEPVGETIELPGSHVILQSPNPNLVNFLQSIDPRIRYFPTNKDQATSEEEISYISASMTHLRKVVDNLPAQVAHDFPPDTFRTTLRGTVVSLTDEFPHYQERRFTGQMEPNDAGDYRPVYDLVGEPLPMSNVLSVLRDGGDRGGNVSAEIMQSATSSTGTSSALHETNLAIAELLHAGEVKKAGSLFPAVLVYDTDKLQQHYAGQSVDPRELLLAVYITDRVISNL